MRRLLSILLFVTLAGIAVADVSVTGKWSGTIAITHPNGETEDSGALLVLTQNGTEVTGSVGPDEDKRFNITKGKIEGDKITLEVEDEGRVIKFALVLAEDHIKGEANMSGPNGESAKAKLDVARSK